MTKIEGQFRQAAVDLAAQLQAASRTAAELAVSLGQAEQIIGLLKKYMTTTQLVHAQLEIDTLPAQGLAACRAQQRGSTPDPADGAPDAHAVAFQLLADADGALQSGAERLTAFSYFMHGVTYASGLQQPAATCHAPSEHSSQLDTTTALYRQELAP